MQYDETDRRLITLLQSNARLPVADLARRLGIARTTVKSRLERLEFNGVIEGYTIRLSAHTKARLRATQLLSIEPHTNADILSRLKSLPIVETVHTVSGRFDLIVQLVADTTEELDSAIDFISAAKGVRSSESLIHLTTKIDRTGH